MSVFSLVRGGYGGLLLTAPGMLVRAYEGRPSRRADVAVARVLGARQILQAVACAGSPTRSVLLLGAQADTVHALSAVALLIGDRTRRRAGLVEVLIASSFAIAGYLLATRAPAHRRPTGHEPLDRVSAVRDGVAERIAELSIPAWVRGQQHANRSSR